MQWGCKSNNRSGPVKQAWQTGVLWDYFGNTKWSHDHSRHLGSLVLHTFTCNWHLLWWAHKACQAGLWRALLVSMQSIVKDWQSTKLMSS